jgi:hypothetical protein
VRLQEKNHNQYFIDKFSFYFRQKKEGKGTTKGRKNNRMYRMIINRAPRARVTPEKQYTTTTNLPRFGSPSFLGVEKFVQ